MPPPEHHDDERPSRPLGESHDGLPDDDRLLEAIRAPEADVDADVAIPGPALAVDLARLGGLVRSLSDDDFARDEPPPAVWAGIAARTGAGSTAAAPGEARAAAATVPEAVPIDPAGSASAPPGGVGAPEGQGATGPGDDDASSGVVPLHARRRTGPSGWILGAVATAAALLLVLAGIVAIRDGDDDPVVVASAQVEPLPDQPTGDATSVEARVVETDGGLELALPLADADLPEPAGFYEVWLIDPNVDGMVSLGPARADGVYIVPADIDVAAFPIVDVSVEPVDGLPVHSGVSVLRGTLA